MGFDWQNSFAPNDSYVHISQAIDDATDKEKGRGRAVNTTGVTDETYREQAYGMLRKRKNPRPNLMDRIMFESYTKLGVYLPVTAFFAIFDFAVDWRNSFQLMGTNECHLNAFGLMMLLTVTAVPVIFSLISPSEEEFVMWDFVLRMLTGTMIDPLEEDEVEKNPTTEKLIWYGSYILYMIFSPFTCIVSQVQLHLTQTHAIGYYLEFTHRSKKVIRELHEGSFDDFNQEEFESLKELQIRAVHYVKYHVAFCKDRLKYCLIEDCIQFNIQVTMFLYKYFTFYKTSPVEFAQNQGLWFADGLTADRQLMYDTLIKVGGTASAVLMIWIGYYSTEKTHEQLVKRKQIGFVRVIATAVRISIELIIPSFCMTMFVLNSKGSLIQAPDGNLDIKGCHVFGSNWNTLRIYAVFPFAFTLITHYSWSFILNVTNQGEMSWERTKRTLADTWRMCVYNSFITIKYTRLATPLETVPQPYTAGWKQHLMLFLSLFIKFSLPLAIFLRYIPDEFRPKETFGKDPACDDSDPTCHWNYKTIDIDYRLKYGLTNDIHYLSYLRFLDKDSDYARVQVTPVYLAETEKYWIEEPILDIDSELSNVVLDGSEDFGEKYDHLQFRNKHDFQPLQSEQSADNYQARTAFSFLYTYDMTDDIKLPAGWRLDGSENLIPSQFKKPLTQRLVEAYGCRKKAELIAKMQLKHLRDPKNNFKIDCIGDEDHVHLDEWNRNGFPTLPGGTPIPHLEDSMNNFTETYFEINVDQLRTNLFKYIKHTEAAEKLTLEENIGYDRNSSKRETYTRNLKKMTHDDGEEGGFWFDEDVDKLYNQWYEVIIEEPVLLNQPAERAQYEFNRFVYQFVGEPKDTGELRVNLFYYWFLFVWCFHILYVMGEMEHPTWSEVMRFEHKLFSALYPLIVPIGLTYFAAYFEFMSVQKSQESFCRMHPQVKNDYWNMVTLDCQSVGEASSMTRCAYGTTCYYMSHPNTNGETQTEQVTLRDWEGGNVIHRVPFFKNMRIGKIEANALGLYKNHTEAEYPDMLMCDGKLKENGCLTVHGDTMKLYDTAEFEKNFNEYTTPELYSPLRYLNSELKSLFIEIFGTRGMTSLTCVINQDMEKVQFGDVIWDDQVMITTSPNYGKKIKRESKKCMDAIQGIVTKNPGELEAVSGGVERYYAGLYTDKTNALTQAQIQINHRFDSFSDNELDSDVTTNLVLGDDVTDKRAAHSQMLNDYLEQALECYHLEEWFYFEYGLTEHEKKWWKPWYDPAYRLNVSAISEGRLTAEETSNYYNYFHESCTDQLSDKKLFSRTSNINPRFYSRSDVEEIMNDFVGSATKSYILIPDGDDKGNETDTRKGLMINWPVDITQENELVVLKEKGLEKLGYLMSPVDLTVDKYNPKSANFELADADPDFVNQLPLFNPLYHYSPETMKRRFNSEQSNRLGSDDLHIVLPWWEPCSSHNDPDAFYQTNSSQLDRLESPSEFGWCIKFDDSQQEQYYKSNFAFWKLNPVQQLDTEALAQLLDAALDQYDDFKEIVLDVYGPRKYDPCCNGGTPDSSYHSYPDCPEELPYYEHPSNIIDAERNNYLNQVKSREGRMDSDYIKPGCFYEKQKYGSGNTWRDEYNSLTSSDTYYPDAEFIVNQLTIHEIKKHVVAAFINADYDLSSVSFPLTMDKEDFNRETAKTTTSAWPWRVGTQYKRTPEGKFYCVDPNNATWTEEHSQASKAAYSCINEWETYQFDYITALQAKANPNAQNNNWLELELNDKSILEVGQSTPFFWTINAKPWLHRQLEPLEYDTKVFKKDSAQACNSDPCFLEWDIQNWRDDKFMKYKLARENIFVPFWPDWQVYKNRDSTSDFEDWVKEQPEYVQVQNSTDPWTIDNETEVTTMLSSGCVFTDSDFNVRVLGVGMNMDEDTLGSSSQSPQFGGLGWSGKGYKDRSLKRLKIELPYAYDQTTKSNGYFKPSIDIQEQHDWNLQFVNTYVATIDFTDSLSGNVRVVDEWKKFEESNYADTLRDGDEMKSFNFVDESLENDPINVDIGLDSSEGTVRLQRVKQHMSTTKFSTNKAFHFFGKNWDAGTFDIIRQYYQKFGGSQHRFSAKILDFDYSYFNMLPNEPLYVAVNSVDGGSDSESETYLHGQIVDKINKGENTADLVRQLKAYHEQMELHAPAKEVYNVNKTYTQFQSHDLHITDQCIKNPDNPDEVFLFGTVRRLKPFYYYYCDKWNDDQFNYNPKFDQQYRNNFTDKFGRLDSLKDLGGKHVEDQAYLITHNFVQPKKKDAATFRLSDFNYICDNALINEEDTIYNFPNDTWTSMNTIYRDWLSSTGGNQAPKSVVHRMEKTWIEYPYKNDPNDINLLKSRFIPYFSARIPASPVMAELYWDAHDDLVDPNRYEMGTEAHPGVYSLSFLGHKDFQIEVNKTKFGDIMMEDRFILPNGSNIYIETDARFYTGGYLGKNDNNPYFPSKHLQYHLHPKWQQKYPRQGPLRDVEADAFQKKLQDICKMLDVGINQKYYINHFTNTSSSVYQNSGSKRPTASGEKKQFRPEWSYAEKRMYTTWDDERAGNYTEVPEWNQTTRWNPNQKSRNLDITDFGNEFFWATTNRPAELFNYTLAWKTDEDFRTQRSFAERVQLGNRMYQPDHSFMEQSGIDTKWFGLWRAPDWKTGKTYVAGTRDLTVESPPLHFLGYLPPVESDPNLGRSSSWNHPLATSLITRYPDYKEYQTYASQARRMNGAVWREWEAYMPKAGYTPSPNVRYFFNETKDDGTLTIEFDLAKYFSSDSAYSWEVKTPWSKNCEKDANANETAEWVSNHCGNETWGSFEYYNPKKLIPLSFSALDMRPDLLTHGLVPGTDGVKNSGFPKGRKHQLFYYPRWIRDPLPFAPEQSLYNERSRELFPGASLYLGAKGKLRAHHGTTQSKYALDQMVPGNFTYPDPFRFPWRHDFLEENNYRMNATIKGLKFLENKMVDAEGEEIELKTFDFFQNNPPNVEYEPTIVKDNLGKKVQFPTVRKNQQATAEQFARCEGIWNLFPVDPFKLAFQNNFSKPLSRFDQALLFRTEYDRGNSRIGPKEYGFDTVAKLPIVDNYHVEPGQSELAFGLLANPMLFKNNLSYIDVGYETTDGVPEVASLSLNDMLMAAYYENPLMWSGLDDKFQQSYYERYQSSQSFKNHFSGRSSFFPIDREIPMVRSQGFRSVYGFNQWGRPSIYKDDTPQEKRSSFELMFRDPMNVIESIAVKPGKTHDSGLPWMYWTFVADRKIEDDDYLRFVAGHKERMPFWRKMDPPQNESHWVEPNPRWHWDKYPPSKKWGISESAINEWKNIVQRKLDNNEHYRIKDIPPVYSRKHYDDNIHPLEDARKKFLKYFMEPFVIDQQYKDNFKQYLKKDRRMLRPEWSIERMNQWIMDMEAKMGKEFYQLFHYEDIGRFCSNNYIPNIDHRWYWTEQVLKSKIEDGSLSFRKDDDFMTNFQTVDENARIQDFLPQNIIMSIKNDEPPFWSSNDQIQTPKRSRAPKHPYELPDEENPYFRKYNGTRVDPNQREEVPMIRNFADSWEPLDLDRVFMKPTKHFTKYDDKNPLFTLTGFEFIDQVYDRNVEDVDLKDEFYLQLQNKNIPYPKEKPAPTNFVPKLLSLMKMYYNGIQTHGAEGGTRLMHVNGGDFLNCIEAQMANTTRNDYYITRAQAQARDFHLYGYRYVCKEMYEPKTDKIKNWEAKIIESEELLDMPGCDVMPNYPNLTAHLASLTDPAQGDKQPYIAIDYFGMPATMVNGQAYGNRVGDKAHADSDPYDPLKFKALNPVNPTTFIPFGVSQVDFNYCADWADLSFHLVGMSEADSANFKFGPDMHWMRLYDNYLNNHLYENDGVGGNFGNFDDLVYPPVHDPDHEKTIRFPDPRYYGDHGSGKHAGLSDKKAYYGKNEFYEKDLLPNAAQVAETTDQEYTAWSKMDIYSLLDRDFFRGSSSKDLRAMRNLYNNAGQRWSEPGLGGFNALGDSDIIDDSLTGASLKFLDTTRKSGVVSPALKAIDPREQFFKSFEDELGLTADALKVPLTGDSAEITQFKNDLQAYDVTELNKTLYNEAVNFPTGYKHDFKDYNKFQKSNDDLNKPVCSARIFDPLQRFQPWDTSPQLLSTDGSFLLNNDGSFSSQNDDAAPFILADPMVVAPYSLVFKVTFDSTEPDLAKQTVITFDSVIESGLSPQYGACTTIQETIQGVDSTFPICLGGVVMGKLTNKALIRRAGAWKAESNYDLPLPMMHHSVVATDETLYVFGGKIPSLNDEHHQVFPYVLRFNANCLGKNQDCRLWDRIMVPRTPTSVLSRAGNRFNSFRHTTIIQPATSKIHSALHFCSSDLNDPVERWRNFGANGMTAGSSRRRRSTEGMFYFLI